MVALSCRSRFHDRLRPDEALQRAERRRIDSASPSPWACKITSSASSSYRYPYAKNHRSSSHAACSGRSSRVVQVRPSSFRFDQHLASGVVQDVGYAGMGQDVAEPSGGCSRDGLLPRWWTCSSSYEVSGGPLQDAPGRLEVRPYCRSVLQTTSNIQKGPRTLLCGHFVSQTIVCSMGHRHRACNWSTCCAVPRDSSWLLGKVPTHPP